MPWNAILLILTISAPLAMVIIEKSNKTLYKDNGRLNKAGWWFYGIAILGALAGLGVGITNDRAQERMEGKINGLEQYNVRRDSLDSLKDARLSLNNKLRWDSTKGEYSKIDSQLRLQDNPTFVIGSRNKIKIEKPLLKVFGNEKIYSPIIVPDEEENVFKFTIHLYNFRNAIGYNLKNSISLVARMPDGNYSVSTANNNSFNETTMADNITVFFITHSLLNINKLDTGYVYVKVRYTDSLNIEQSPFRGLYYVNSRTINKKLDDVNEATFNEVKKILQKKKAW